MHKKVSIVLVILVTLILIAVVIWVFEKRINRIDSIPYSTEQKN